MALYLPARVWYTETNYVCIARKIPMRDNEQRRPEAEADGIIEGRNAVIEALVH